MPIAFLCLFCFGFFPNPIHPVFPTSPFLALIFLFLLVRKHLRIQPVLLNLDLIYSTNMWETWKLDCFVLFLSVWDADCVLKMMIIYAKSALPSLSSTFPHEKVTVRLPVGSRGAGTGTGLERPRALVWRGGDWNSCLISILLIKQVLVGF